MGDLINWDEEYKKWKYLPTISKNFVIRKSRNRDPKPMTIKDIKFSIFSLSRKSHYYSWFSFIVFKGLYSWNLKIIHLYCKQNLSNSRMLFKIKEISKYWQGCWKIGSLAHCRWECKVVQPIWKTSKNKKYNYHMIQKFYFLVYSQKDEKQGLDRCLYTNVCAQQHYSQ